VLAAVEAAGARVQLLPVYSPDLTPIEEIDIRLFRELYPQAEKPSKTRPEPIISERFIFGNWHEMAI
jgi:hypothetical protein